MARAPFYMHIQSVSRLHPIDRGVLTGTHTLPAPTIIYDQYKPIDPSIDTNNITFHVGQDAKVGPIPWTKLAAAGKLHCVG
jgi:hypothetical protein